VPEERELIDVALWIACSTNCHFDTMSLSRGIPYFICPSDITNTLHVDAWQPITYARLFSHTKHPC